MLCTQSCSYIARTQRIEHPSDGAVAAADNDSDIGNLPEHLQPGGGSTFAQIINLPREPKIVIYVAYVTKSRIRAC